MWGLPRVVQLVHLTCEEDLQKPICYMKFVQLCPDQRSDVIVGFQYVFLKEELAIIGSSVTSFCRYWSIFCVLQNIIQSRHQEAMKTLFVIGI